MHIFNLRNRGFYIPAIGSWLFDEWGHLRLGSTPEDAIQRLAQRCKGERIPSVYVAEIKNVPVGTISLVECDMDIRPAFTPWVAAVYVHPDYRNRGIGSELMKYIETVGIELGIEKLYLFTPDKQRMYSALGWEVIEDLIYNRMDVSIMIKDLRNKS